jgi:enediyne biosynthesis protein E4
MAASLKQALLIVAFVGLIGVVLGIRYFSKADDGQAGAVDTEKALRNYGFYLKEVSQECGINFQHQTPKLDDRLDHILPVLAAMGASVSVVDFDRDGWPDLYVVNSAIGSKNCLYHNQHDGTFKDVAEEMGVADLNQADVGVCMGAVWGDYDNDGYEDLFVYRWGKPELFHNNKGKGFTRVGDIKLPDRVNANSAIWVDFDRDGHLDLFLTGYWDEKIDLWHLKDTKIMPDSFEYASNGARKYLLRNKGDGTFEDVTEKMGIKTRSWVLAVGAADLCGTGYPDLFVANDYGVPELYANHEGKRFEEIGKKSGVAERPKSGMNVSFGDISNQGRFCTYISNITERGVLLQGNNLWVPKRDFAGDNLRFTNEANQRGVDSGGWSWGAQFGDLNNDGWLDLFLTNGYISNDKARDYWYDYSKVAIGNKTIIADAKNWPRIGDRSLGGYQQKCVWLNKQDRFIDIAQAIGVSDLHDGRAVALVDLWNRGVLDVVVANQKGPLLVYKNTVVPENQWIQFELEGTASNRSAIGAQVRLFWNGRQQVQEVSGGSGYASQNQRRLHFGLGKDPQIEKVEIKWPGPSGQTQTISAPETGKLHVIREPQ